MSVCPVTQFKLKFPLLLVGISTLSFPHLAMSQSTTTADIERIAVVGTSPHRYQTNSGDSLVGLPLEFLELPRIVDVIPEQLLLDQKVTELEEALRNVPGVSLSDGFGGSNNDYLIRGFRLNTIYRDGLRVESNFRVNTSNLDSIRVIKGPASITYGQVEPGGLVDVITKKPLDSRRFSGEVRAGSWDNYLVQGDISTPLGDDAAIRANFSHQDAGSFRDFFDIKRDAIALSGRYDIAPSTQVNLSYEYRDEFRSFDRGTITVPTANGREIINNLKDIPISRRFGEAFEEIDTQFEFSTANIKHSFDNGWQLKIGGAWENSTSDDLQARPGAAVILAADAPIVDGYFTATPTQKEIYDEDDDRVFMVRRTDGSRDSKTHVSYFNALLSGEITTGSINHRIAIGGDRRRYESSRYFIATPVTNGVPVSMGGGGPLFDIENPVYGHLPDSLSTVGASKIYDATEDYGIFINDYMELTSSLSLLVGGRLDYSDVDRDGPANEVNAFSPQFAVNYRIGDNISTFASYSEAFSPNTAFKLDSSGSSSETELFDPENSKQYEWGSKGQFFDGKLNSSISVYKIEKENVLTSVNDNYELIKGQQSQGLELQVNGQPVPGWTVMAGYAYTDAEILSEANAGNTPKNVAEHNGSIWTSYEFHQGSLQGFGSGIGAFYMGDRYGDDANTWELGSYTTVDVSVWYTLSSLGKNGGNIRFQLSAKNILDKTYYSASGGDLRVSIGTPRSIYASVSATF